MSSCSAKVLGSLASVLPASNGLVQLQLAMQRRCPAGVPDAMAVILLVLLLLVVVLWAEAAWSWKIPDPEEEKNAVWPEEVVRLKSAFQNFRTGFGYSDLESCLQVSCGLHVFPKSFIR